VHPHLQRAEEPASTLGRLRTAVPEADVLVIDDQSPDGTGELADELAARDPRVHVLHGRTKAGLSVAYVSAFAWGLERGYDVLVEMDADGSHQPEELPRLLAALHSADVVLGSRWVAEGQVRNWPHSRWLLSRGANTYVRGMLRMPLSDATGGSVPTGRRCSPRCPCPASHRRATASRSTCCGRRGGRAPASSRCRSRSSSEPRASRR